MIQSQRIDGVVIRNNSQLFIFSFMACVALIAVYAVFKNNIRIGLGAIVLLLAFFALLKPYQFFLSYISLIPLVQIYRFFSTGPIFELNFLKDAAFILFVVIWFSSLLSKTHGSLTNMYHNRVCNRIMILFMCYMFIQTILAPNLMVGILGLREVVEFMFAFFLAQFFFTTESRVKKCIQLVFLSGLMVAILGIVQQILGLHYNPKMMRLAGVTMHRLSSTLGDFNIFGFFMAISILVAIYLLSEKQKTHSYKIFLSCSIVLMIICLFLSYSRSAFVALCVGIMVLSIRKHNIKIIIVSAILIVFTFIFMPSEVSLRLSGLRYGIDSGRREMWTLAWDQFKQHPIIGVGYGKVGGIYGAGRSGPLAGYLAGSTDDMLVTDNAYLFLLTEAGIIGFGLFALLLFLILKKGWAMKKEFKKSESAYYLNDCLLAISLAICVGAISFNIFGMFFPINFYFWLLVGIMVNLKNIEAV